MRPWCSLARRLDRPAPGTPRRTQRDLLTETVLVVVVAFGTSSVAAISDLASRLNGQYVSNNAFLYYIPRNPGLAVFLATVYLLVRTGAVVGPVIWVLRKSGESLRTIGLTLDQPRRDLLLLVPFGALALIFQRIGFVVGFQAFKPPATPYVQIPVPAVYVITAVARSIESGNRGPCRIRHLGELL